MFGDLFGGKEAQDKAQPVIVQETKPDQAKTGIGVAPGIGAAPGIGVAPIISLILSTISLLVAIWVNGYVHGIAK